MRRFRKQKDIIPVVVTPERRDELNARIAEIDQELQILSESDGDLFQARVSGELHDGVYGQMRDGNELRRQTLLGERQRILEQIDYVQAQLAKVAMRETAVE